MPRGWPGSSTSSTVRSRSWGCLATWVWSLGLGRLSKQRNDLPTELGSYANNPKGIPSLNLNYNTGTVRTFLQGELLLQDDLPNNEFTTRYYDDGRVIESQVPENREQTHYVVRAGSDWTLDASNVLSVSGVYDFETHTDRAQVPFILQSTGERERFWFWREKEDTGFANISVDWERQFATPGHEMGMNRYTRCSMSMFPKVSINGRIRSSGQLGRWWYSISPCRNNECVRRFTVFAFNQRS